MERRAELSLHGDADVLDHREVREHGRDLERANDAAPRDRRGLVGRDVTAFEENVPRGRNEELGQQVEARRLAGAVRSDQGVDRAAPHAQVDLVDGDEALELLREGLRLEDQVRAHAARFAAGRAALPPMRSVSARATSIAASRWRAPRSAPSRALLMQTETAAATPPAASNTGAPKE